MLHTAAPSGREQWRLHRGRPWGCSSAQVASPERYRSPRTVGPSARASRRRELDRGFQRGSAGAQKQAANRGAGARIAAALATAFAAIHDRDPDTSPELASPQQVMAVIDEVMSFLRGGLEALGHG
jgi:hypothetical protein